MIHFCSCSANVNCIWFLSKQAASHHHHHIGDNEEISAKNIQFGGGLFVICSASTFFLFSTILFWLHCHCICVCNQISNPIITAKVAYTYSQTVTRKHTKTLSHTHTQCVSLKERQRGRHARTHARRQPSNHLG